MPLTQVQPGMLGTPQPYNFKNRWINGNMAINQRGGTVTATGSEPYSLDRWKGADVTSGVFTMQQASDAPTGSGFQYSLQATVTTAAASISAGDYAFLRQVIEGYNSADLAWGTASAKTITVSFWVKSSVTGTYSLVLINEATTQCYPATYTINAANTWEFKTITIPGSTTGVWGSTNGIGIYCDFSLATGSNYTKTPNAWSSSLALGATGQVNWLLTNGNTFYLTGCQFEVGVSATTFDFRSFGTELGLCQRYYEVATIPSSDSIWVGALGFSSSYFVYWNYKVTKRAQPIVTLGPSASWGGATASIFPGRDATQFYHPTTAFFVAGTSGVVGTIANAEL